MTSKPEIMTSCVKLLLKPVVRFCIRQTLKIQEIIDLIKIVFVEVAIEELQAQAKEASASRISVITGVHRKDVNRIRKNVGEVPKSSNLISKVMVKWQHHKKYSDGKGKPKKLNCEGAESEFAQLVESVNGGDLSGYAVLFEMERMGIVERKGSKVKLLWRDYIPPEDLQEQLLMLAEDSDDLISSVEENIFSKPETPNLHLKTEFDRIPKSAVPQIKTWLIQEGSKFQEKVRVYLTKFDDDFNPGIGKEGEFTRVAVGTFSVTDVCVSEE